MSKQKSAHNIYYAQGKRQVLCRYSMRGVGYYEVTRSDLLNSRYSHPSFIAARHYLCVLGTRLKMRMVDFVPLASPVVSDFCIRFSFRGFFVPLDDERYFPSLPCPVVLAINFKRIIDRETD